MVLRLNGYALPTSGADAPDGGAGVLHALGPGRPAKAVSSAVLRLLAAAAAGPVRVGPDAPWAVHDVAAVVLDGVAVLDLGGRSVTGPAAVDDLFPTLVEEDPAAADGGGTGVAAELAARALAWGAAHRGERDLAELLYGYGRLPVGDRDQRRLPDRAAVRRWLGIADTPPWLDAWSAHDLRDAGWWHLWHLRASPRGLDRSRPVLKLYVSPRPADVPDALRVLLDAAAELGVPSVKVGSDVHAVHRPDKLVAYAADEEQLDALATVVVRRLRGLPAHGVPFTADRSADGLVTWAADPALDDTGGQRTSWRQLVTELAADGLRRGRRAGLDQGRCVAVARAWLWVNDVDPVGWAPVAA